MFLKLKIDNNDHVSKTMEFLNRPSDFSDVGTNWRGILRLCNISSMTDEEWSYDSVQDTWETHLETWDEVFRGLHKIRDEMFPENTGITMYFVTSSKFCYFYLPKPQPDFGWSVPRESHVYRHTTQFPEISELWTWMWDHGCYPYGNPEDKEDMTSITPRPSNDNNYLGEQKSVRSLGVET